MATSTIILLCLAAFAAGFVDAIAGGGGLIQVPASLIILPNLPVATVIGSLKIPAFTGTFFATLQYLKKVKIQLLLLLIMMVLAFCCSLTGSYLLTKVQNSFMKPVLLVVLFLVAIYTYTKKNLGAIATKQLSLKKQILFGVMISIIIGLYDGFIGPGAGSFFILAFIAVLGYDFLHASAYAKMVNLATNAGSIVLFTAKGIVIWQVAVPMAFCNALGGIVGAKLAIKKGNQFIRYFFLIVVLLTIIRFGWDVFGSNQ